jgi:hypothetical protein
MTYADWAESVARDLVAGPLPRRWAHTQGVAAKARTIAPIMSNQAGLLTAAAWLHDIGYSPAIAVTGFHPLDGARHLRDTHEADALICRLVAHHSCAVVGAAELDLADDLTREFPAPPADLNDALAYCDMTTGPDGQSLAIEDRLSEILSRYGPDDVVSRAIIRSTPDLAASVARLTGRLDAARTDCRALLAERLARGHAG